MTSTVSKFFWESPVEVRLRFWRQKKICRHVTQSREKFDHKTRIRIGMSTKQNLPCSESVSEY